MTDWRPTAPSQNLRLRADLLRRTREFFAVRDVLEVETPLLASAPVTDPHIAALRTEYFGPGSPTGRTLYLQTSPEYAMKRMLAAGSGSIYQICKAFRAGEAGRLHNPEFTMLEWYRIGFDHNRLMDEIDELISELINRSPAERLSYGSLFEERIGIDPHTASRVELSAAAALNGIEVDGTGADSLDRDDWLQLLFSGIVEPQLGRARPTFVSDYPASQCALAKMRDAQPRIAERFELFVDGLELANGYHELCDPDQHKKRFERDLASRRELGLPEVPVDERFISSLEAGLESCAGVALGFDRLVMIAAGANRVQEVLAFPIENA